MAWRWLVALGIPLLAGCAPGAVPPTTPAPCAVGERPGYFVPHSPGSRLALVGCARLGVSGKPVEFSAARDRVGRRRHTCINPTYRGRSRFIPGMCKLEPPLSHFAVRDARRPRQATRGYAYVIWGTAGSATEVVARFSGGTARAAILEVGPDLARRFEEAPFALFVVELPLPAACGAVTIVGERSERVAPKRCG